MLPIAASLRHLNASYCRKLETRVDMISRPHVVLPSLFFLAAMSVQAQDPGAAAAMQAAQQATQAAQQASQQAMQALQQANQNAQQFAQQAQQAASDSGQNFPRRDNNRADQPHFYPAAGKFSSATWVSIQESTPNAVIYYTLDGSKPTASSTLYIESILISRTSRLRAIAYSRTKSLSKVMSAKYVVK